MESSWLSRDRVQQRLGADHRGFCDVHRGLPPLGGFLLVVLCLVFVLPAVQTKILSWSLAVAFRIGIVTITAPFSLLQDTQLMGGGVTSEE